MWLRSTGAALDRRSGFKKRSAQWLSRVLGFSGQVDTEERLRPGNCELGPKLGRLRAAAWDPLFNYLDFARLCDPRRRNNVVFTSCSRDRAANWDEGRRFLPEINALEAVVCAVSRSPSQRKEEFFSG